MSNSVEFYTISFRNKKNNKEIEYVSVDLRAFFDLLEQALSEESTEKLREVDYRAILAPKVYRNKDFIVIPFGKLKDGKVYTSNKDNFEEIDSDVFEITSIAYDINFNIAMKTINKFGPSVTLIEEYINSFLPSDCPYVISFIPILQNYGLEKLRNAKIVKSITLEFDFGNGINKYFYENMEDNGGIRKSLNKILTTLESLCKKASAFLLETNVPLLPKVINFSTLLLTSLALASVVTTYPLVITVLERPAKMLLLMWVSLFNFLILISLSIRGT